MESFKLSDRVKVTGKNISGKIAFIGKTHFSEGEWYGIILDEAVGKNNGSIEGKRYFKCPSNYGLFVRCSQLEKITAKNKTQTAFNANNKISTKKLEKTKQKAKDKIQLNRDNNSFENHPMNGVIADLQQILKRKEEDLSDVKLQKKEANDKLKAAEAQQQKMSKKLEIMVKVEYDLKKELTAAQSEVNSLKKKLHKTQKHFEFIRKMQCETDLKIEKLMEITEFAVVEKEIAEENFEQAEQLIKEEVDKREVLETQMNIVKEEMQLQVMDGLPAVHYVKQLENDNEVLKSALYRLRDLYENKQKEFLIFRNEVGKYSKEIEDLKLARKSMEETLRKSKEEATELYETIDSMMNADEIVCEVVERNLKIEEEINNLSQALYNTEDQLEVSEEVQETLQDIQSISNEEIDYLTTKISRIQTELNQKINLLKDSEEVIYKYRELTGILWEKSSNLSQEINILRKERKDAVKTAENLKLKIYREQKRSMNELIEIGNIKCDLQIYNLQFSYWVPFMPDNFFAQDGENAAIQAKLITERMVKKLNLLIKFLQPCFNCSKALNSDELKSLSSKCKFLIFTYELHEILILFSKSFDHSKTEVFLTFGKYQEILMEKNKEIDCYLKFFAHDEIDAKCCMSNIENTCRFLSQFLNTEYVQNFEKTMIHIVRYLNIIQISCKCIFSFCISFKGINENPEDYKFKFRTDQIMKMIKKITVSARAILKLCRNWESEKVYLSQVIESKIKNIWKIIQTQFECFIQVYEKLLENNEDITTDEFKRESISTLNDISYEFLQCEMEFDKLQKDLDRGEYFTEFKSDSQVLSVVDAWAAQKKQEREQVITNMRTKVTSCELEIIDLAAKLQSEKKHNCRIIKVPCKDTSQQTDESTEIISPSGDNNSVSTNYLKLQLHDMECSMRYLSQKNFELMCATMKNRQEILTPLDILPKSKYNPNTHTIISLQKRLNKLAQKIQGILMPTVVDVSKNHSSIEKKYRNYVTERALVRREVEDEIWNIVIEVKKLKALPRCIWSNTNPFSL